MCDLILGCTEYEQTGDTAALRAAFNAFKARVKEKERIANN